MRKREGWGASIGELGKVNIKPILRSKDSPAPSSLYWILILMIVFRTSNHYDWLEKNKLELLHLHMIFHIKCWKHCCKHNNFGFIKYKTKVYFKALESSWNEEHRGKGFEEVRTSKRYAEIVKLHCSWEYFPFVS